MQKPLNGGFILEGKKMGYEIGDKVIYISPFNKPMN